jgi:ribose/xylose/arabinose/galactoside ABC-type transport system permease subunit
MQSEAKNIEVKESTDKNGNVPFYRSAQFWKQTGIFWALILLIIIMAFSQPAFLTKPNLINILKQASITGILAVGMTLVLLTGGIDLGVGSVLAVACMAAAYATTETQGWPIIAGFVLGIGVGAIFGLINGFGIAYINFAPFIMTMATLSAARGLALVSTNNRPIFNLSRQFINVSNSIYFGLPSLIFYFLGVAILAYILTKNTVFGKWIYAIGGNENAARYSGINVKKVKLIIYTIMGALSGLTGVLMASRITSGNPTVGEGYELDAIAACVIGGVSLAGGVGSVIGTVIGVLILGVISNGFDILGISTNYQRIMKGLVILLAVFIDIRSRRRKNS